MIFTTCPFWVIELCSPSLSAVLLTDYHHNSIIKLSVRLRVLGRSVMISLSGLKPSANKRQKHETKRFSISAVYRLRHCETKKHCFANVILGIKQCMIQETCFHRIMCETKTNVYVSLYRKRVSLINVSAKFCLPFVLSRNSPLRDAKPAEHLFV